MSGLLYPAHQRIAPVRRHLARGARSPLPDLPGPAPARADDAIGPLPAACLDRGAVRTILAIARFLRPRRGSRKSPGKATVETAPI